MNKDNYIALKIFFDIADSKIGLYRSFKVFPNTTFSELTRRIEEKIYISANIVSYFRLLIRYFSPIRLLKLDYVPLGDDDVLNTISREELHWPGEIVLIYADIRRPFERQKELNSHMQSQRAPRISPAIFMTEFTPNGYDGETVSNITSALSMEIDDLCIKRGKLQKLLKGPAMIWR